MEKSESGVDANGVVCKFCRRKQILKNTKQYESIKVNPDQNVDEVVEIERLIAIKFTEIERLMELKFSINKERNANHQNNKMEEEKLEEDINNKEKFQDSLNIQEENLFHVHRDRYISNYELKI